MRCASRRSDPWRATRRSSRGEDDPARVFRLRNGPTAWATAEVGGSPLDRIISKGQSVPKPWTSRGLEMRPLARAIRQVVEDRLAADSRSSSEWIRAGPNPRREDEELNLIDKTIDVLVRPDATTSSSSSPSSPGSSRAWGCSTARRTRCSSAPSRCPGCAPAAAHTHLTSPSWRPPEDRSRASG